MAYKFQLGAYTASGSLSQKGNITPGSADGADLGSAAAEFSDVYLADASVIKFGADQEVTLTHVHNTGLLLSDDSGTGTTALQFGDSGTYINQSTDGTLALVADNIMAFDAQGTDSGDGYKFSLGADNSDVKFQILNNSAQSKFHVDGTGAVSAGGSVTAVGSFIIGSADMNEADLEKLDGITNGTAAASKAVVLDASKNIATIGTIGCGAITSTGNSSFGQGSFSSGVIPSSADGAALGSASKEWSDLYLADGGIVYLGNDQDVQIQHSADSGIIVQNTNAGGANAAMLKLQLSSSTPADDDEIGKLVFSAFNDAAPNEATVYGQILMKSTDVSNGTEDGSMGLNVIRAGSPVEFINIHGTTADTVTFVDGAYDVDIASHDGTNGLKLGGTLVSADAAELNKLDGYTGTTAELNYLDLTTLGTSEASKVVSADASGDITLAGASANIKLDKSADDLIFQDDMGAVFGTGNDMRLIHASNQNYISASAQLNVATLNSGVAISIGHTTSEVTVNDNLTVTGDLTVNGTTTSVNSTTIAITSSFTFEGTTPDSNETVLGVVDPTADTTINLPALSAGTYYVPVLAAASTTAISSTPAELNLLDGSAKSTSSITIADADAFIVIDGSTTKQIPASDLKTFVASAPLTIQAIDDSGTCVAGVNYFADLGGAESVTLPASPSNGDVVIVKAPSNCSTTNVITINRAGSQTIDGETAIKLVSPYAAVSIAYVGSDLWRIY